MAETVFYNSRNLVGIGNVGIGTASPTSLLDVALNQDTNQGAHLRNASAGVSAVATWGIGNANGDIRGGIGLFGSAYTTSSIYRRDGVYTWSHGAGGYTINSSAANSNVYIAVATTERMRITSAGNVGIGTTDPGGPLDVLSSYTLSARFRGISDHQVQYYSGAAGATFTGQDGGSSTYRYFQNNTEDKMRFYQGAGGNVILQPTAGNVGIRTANPGATLQVAGNVYASSLCTSGGGTSFITSQGGHMLWNTSTWTGYGSSVFATQQGVGSGGFGWVNYNNSNQLTANCAFLSAGGGLALGAYSNVNDVTAGRFICPERIGIGTASPGYPLFVNYTNSSGGVNETGIYINNTAKTNSAQLTLASGNVFSIIAQGSFGSPSNGFSIYNTTKSSSPFNITSAGNVGIGTVVPNQPLEIGCNNATGQHPLRLSNYNTGINTTKYIGMEFRGTDQVGTLKDCGQIRVAPGNQDWTTGANMIFLTRSGDTGSVERMRIDGTGYVGIGTASPHALLTFNSTSANKVICLSGIEGTNPLTATDFNGFGVNGTVNLRYQSFSAASGGHVWYMGATEAMRIGVNAGNLCLGIGTADPAVQLHLSTDGARKLTTTTWTTGSDQRIKTDIQSANLQTCYDTIKSIDLKYFKWNFPVESNVSVDDKHSLGFIAQDVKAVFPNAVFESNSYGFTDFLSLNTDQILKAMYGALRQTMSDKESLETQLQTAQNDIDLLESRLAAIEALISTNTSADTSADTSTGTRAEGLLSQV